MKKKITVIILLIGLICLLSSCTSLSGKKLEAIFGGDETSTITSGQTASTSAADSQSGDTVTISREEYEKLLLFSDLAELYDAANEGYYQDTDPVKMLDYAAKGLLTGLDDPYTFYYTPQEFAELWEDDEGKYTGIGVLITSNYTTQVCTISRVFEGSPAEAAGVQRGDILYKVGEDMFVNASNIDEAVDIMRGLPGTDVVVTFLRNDEEITFTITRQEISVNQVESTMLDNEVGYIVLYQFAGECEKEFSKALDSLVEQGAKGIILDLRDNPGGWVESASRIADLFMDEGETCYLVYKGGKEVHGEYVTYDGKVDTKLVVLINENSASSSEILTAVLRERADATIVGVTSYGKGIIQGVYPVGNRGAGFQMTIAQYYTPGGTAVHKIGITPDIEVSLPEGDNGMYKFADIEHDIQLQAALEAVREKLSH